MTATADCHTQSQEAISSQAAVIAPSTFQSTIVPVNRNSILTPNSSNYGLIDILTMSEPSTFGFIPPTGSNLSLGFSESQISTINTNSLCMKNDKSVRFQ
jgi:hypothetical protein